MAFQWKGDWGEFSFITCRKSLCLLAWCYHLHHTILWLSNMDCCKKLVKIRRVIEPLTTLLCNWATDITTTGTLFNDFYNTGQFSLPNAGVTWNSFRWFGLMVGRLNPLLFNGAGWGGWRERKGWMSWVLGYHPRNSSLMDPVTPPPPSVTWSCKQENSYSSEQKP